MDIERTREDGELLWTLRGRLDAGNWHGNDSAWRMAADLMKVFVFADRGGELQGAPQRRMFSIVDGVVYVGYGIFGADGGVQAFALP